MAEWDVVDAKPAAPTEEATGGEWSVAKEAPKGKPTWEDFKGALKSDAMRLLGQVKEIPRIPQKVGEASERMRLKGEYNPAPFVEAAGLVSPTGVATRAAIPAVKAGSAAGIDLIEKAYTQAYDTLKNLDVSMKRSAVHNLHNEIVSAMEGEQFADFLFPKTARAVGRLLESKSYDPPVAHLENVRKLLNRIIDKDLHSRTADELPAAMFAKNKLTSYMAKLPDQDLVGGDAAGIKEIIKAARGNYAAAARSEEIRIARELAESQADRTGKGANLNNKIRQKIGSIRDDIIKNGKQGWSDEEIAQMDRIINGTTVGNTGRLVGTFGPKHPITGWGPAIGSFFAGDMGLGAGILGTGHVAEQLGEASTRRQVGKLDELVRSRAPASQVMPKTGPTIQDLIGTPQGQAVIRSLLMQLGQQKAAQ